MIRRLLGIVSYVVVFCIKPFKVYAYRTRFGIVKYVILTFTKPIDFGLIWLNVQNPAMLIHWKVYRGNFIFGDAVMVTDYDSTIEAIVKPSLRGNNFMGVNIVASDSCVFASNSAMINQCPPLRTLSREYIDRNIFNKYPDYSVEKVGEVCQGVIDAWVKHPHMANFVVLRSTVTRLTFQLLAGVTIPEAETEEVTFAYIRRFAEASLFGRYFQFMAEILGTRKRIRKDVYLRLKQHGIDIMLIDATMFASMFSVGTLVLRCVEDLRRFRIDYATLDAARKRNFIIEVVRLFPTVTSVHRIVEHDETVVVGRRTVHLSAGDEVAYPFVCANRDPAHFPDPDRIVLDRPEEQYAKVLSWSKGAHACPAKEISISLTTLMLDALARRFKLEELRIFNPAF